jgi:hypothetical protein
MTTSVLDVVVRSSAALSGLRSIEGGVQSVQREVQRTSREISRFESSASSSFKSVAGAITGIVGALGLAKLSDGILDNIKTFEQLRAVLNTVEGDATKAAKSFAQITEFTKKTPFELDDVTKSFIILRRTGLDPSMKAMEVFGNVAAANGKKFNLFAEAIADAATGEFDRLKEFGIKMNKQGDSVVATFDNQTKVIGADLASITSYLYDIGNTRYADGIAQQSALMGTAISNVKDAFASFSDQIGQGGLAAAIRDVASEFATFIDANKDLGREIGETLGNAVRSTAEAVKWLYNNMDQLMPVFAGLIAYKMSDMFLTMAASIRVAAVAASSLAVALLANPIGLLAAAIGVVVGLLTKWYIETIKVTNANASAWDILQATAKVLMDRLAPAIEWVKNAWEGMKDVLGKVAGWVKDSINFIIASFISLKDMVVFVVESIYVGFKNTFGRIGEIAKAFGTSLVNFITDPLGGGDAFKPLFETLNKEWSTGIPALASEFKKKVEENFAQDTLGNMGAALAGSMSGFISDVNAELAKTGNAGKKVGDDVAEGAARGGGALAEMGVSARNAGAELAKLAEERTKFKKKLEERVKDLQLEVDTIGMSKRAVEELSMAREAEALKVDESTRALMNRINTLNQEAATKKVANDVKEMVENIRRETAELNQNNIERAISVNLRQAENLAKAEGVQLTQGQIDSIRSATIEYENQKKAIEKRKDVEEKAIKAAEDAEQKRRQEIEKTAQAYERASERMGSAVAAFIMDTQNGLRQLVGAFISALASVFAAMNGGGGMMGAFFQGMGSGFGGFRAAGGNVDGGKTYVVGEKGPELFTTNRSGLIIPNDQLSMMAANNNGSSSKTSVTIGQISVSSSGTIDDNFINDIAEAIVKGSNIATRRLNK